MNLLSRLRGHRAVRMTGHTVRIALAILVAALVATLTIDLGPGLRALAERQGSRQIERPLHIGRLAVHVFSGRFEVDDLRIDGLAPGDRPFFTAKRVFVALDWSTIFSREITVSTVEMTDWAMLVEKWEHGHNFPKFSRDDKPDDAPRRITTPLKYLHAYRGAFTYEDHEKPWSTASRNLDITIGNLPTYHGTATSSDGTVTIQDHVPMWTRFQARFTIEQGHVKLQGIELQSDGAQSFAAGDVDLGRWPEMLFDVRSRVHFPRMREIFWTEDRFELAGDGDFTGTFHLFKGGHDLKGTFRSDVAGVNAYRFPSLYGALRWTPSTFDVWDAGSKFYGGTATFTYAITGLGEPGRPLSRFDASYAGVDLAAFTDFEGLRGLRFAGSASGRNLLEFPLGRFSEHRGGGTITVTPPAGITIMQPSLAAERAADAGHRRHAWGPFAPVPLPQHLPIAGELTYRYDADDVTLEGGTFATERTHVSFGGTTAWGDRSRIRFHVTSRDWQEADQVLAGIITDFGSPTGTVAFGGRGEFEGVMTGPFRRPRVEGEFAGEDLWAWDTLWGSGVAQIVVENQYVDVTGGVIRLNGSEIRADGRFSLGYPRDDGGTELNARFRVTGRDIDGLRHAFRIDDYPVSGLLSGDFHLEGEYEHPIGFGGMTVENGVAYKEPFQKATASLRFEYAGVRLDGVTIAKAGGTVTGAAFVGWDSTYSFNADGRRIPVERIAAFAYPRAPLSGLVDFSAGGSGTFDQPRYDVKGRVNDLFIGEEGIGQVTASLALRGKELSGELEAASPRLALTATGRIAMTPQSDAEITFRFHDSSLDPYVRLFVPKLSPFTTAVATGSIRIVGELANVDHLLVDTSIDAIDLRLFDYPVKNAGPVHLALDQYRVRLDAVELVGEDTRLRLAGEADLRAERIAVQAAGEANLGILQGFFRDVRGSGRATLRADVQGPIGAPLFSGSATIADGRVRHFALPNALDAINGAIQFDASGIRLDDVSAVMGGGRVQFGGRVALDGYVPGELNVTARGEDMRLRYPEGVRSVVDADLSLRGTLKAPTLAGTVMVKNAVWNKRLDTPGSIFDLVGRRGAAAAAGAGGGSPSTVEAAPTVPLRFDVRVLIPATLRVDNNLLRLVASADLNLRGTYDKPSVYGHADVDRGEILWEGRRYRLTRGAIDFTNPARIDPFFDVEAETTVRVPGQTYRVTVAATGTTERLVPTLTSDPPLPTADVLALLFSDARRTQDAELRALQRPNEAQTDILTTRATQALASPLSAEVGKVVEQTFGVDTFQLTPSFIDPYSDQTGRLNPSARLTIGKRISDRVYLTFSRSLNSAKYDQIILLEYDATDRLSWLLSRNEDQTYALEFRVRHAF